MPELYKEATLNLLGAAPGSMPLKLTRDVKMLTIDLNSVVGKIVAPVHTVKLDSEVIGGLIDANQHPIVKLSAEIGDHYWELKFDYSDKAELQRLLSPLER